MAKFDPTRLIVQLQNTGLAVKDNPQYQLLFQMLKAMAEINTEVNGLSSGSSSSSSSSTIVNQLIQQLNFDSGSNDANNDDLTIPGPQGIDGVNGIVPYFIALSDKYTIPEFKQALFAMNINVEGILEIDGFLIEVDGIPTSVIANPIVLLPEDGIDGLDGFPGIPGVAGINGSIGSIGPPGESGLDGEDNFLYPPYNLQSFTQGSIIFAGPSGALAEDNGQLFWDDTNNRLGIGTAAPGDKMSIGTGAADNRIRVTSNQPYAYRAENAAGFGVQFGASTDAGFADLLITNNGGTENVRVSDGGALRNPGMGAASAGTAVVITGVANEFRPLLSSIRFKENIRVFSGSYLARLLTITSPVLFDYKDKKLSNGKASFGSKNNVGLIAEDVYLAFPEAVNLDENKQPYSLRFDTLIAGLVGAVQELSAEIELLRAKII
jgi:hypothetical protein